MQQEFGEDPPPNPDAEYGRVVHLLYEGKDVPDASADQLDLARAAQDVDRWAIQTWLTAIKAATCKVFGREIRLWARGDYPWAVDGDRIHSGQFDAGWSAVDHDKKRHLLIVDLKSLFGEHQDARTNMQLRDLACLCWENYLTFETVTVYINQPRVTRHPVLVCYQRKDLEMSHAAMIDRVVAQHDPDSQPMAGDTQCQFCTAILQCPAARATTREVTSSSQGGLISGMTPEQWSRFLDACDVAQAVIDRAKARAKELLKLNPNAIPYRGLGKGRTMVKITDPVTFYNRLVERGVSPEAVVKCANFVKERLKVELGAVMGIRGKQLEGQLNELYKGVSEEKLSEPSLIKVT